MQYAWGTKYRFNESLENLRVDDHPCLIYETRAEMIAVAAPFIRLGFERSERCLIFSPGDKIESLLADLAAAGIDTAGSLERGALYLPDVHGIYGRDEPFNPGRVLDFLDRAILDARNDGYAGLRLIGDMPWTLEGTSGAEPLIEYEARLNDFVRSHNLPALCMYDRRFFRPDVLLEVFRTHPKVIAGQVISRSYSYLPPCEFFRPERADAEVNSQLSGMLSNEKLLVTLEQQSALLNAVVANTPDAVYVKDLQGRYLMINPAGAVYFGRTVGDILGRRDDELFAPELADKIFDADRRALASAQPVSSEFTITVAGVTRSFYSITGIYRDAKGEVLGTFGISRDITEQKRSAAAIEDYQEELRCMASEICLAEERERHSIASSLHDQISQTLALAKIKLKSVDWSEDTREEINQVCELLDHAIKHSRSLTIELSPPILYELGFKAAALSLCEEFEERYGLAIQFTDSGSTGSIPDELGGLLYQGLRELLVNVVKHARAKSVSVVKENDGECIRITVEDNGIGFDSNARDIRGDKKHGFGLFSLRERLKYLGGAFSIDSEPGRGTRVSLIAPLPRNTKEQK